MPPVKAANLRAINIWYGNLMAQAKSSRVRRRLEPQQLAKEKRWMDGQQMLQIAHQFLSEGEAPNQPDPGLTAQITSPPDFSRIYGCMHPDRVCCVGAAVLDRLQQLDEDSDPPMKEELDTLLIGVVVAFMFGWFGPVRPGALISLCQPGYQVPYSRAPRSVIKSRKCCSPDCWCRALVYTLTVLMLSPAHETGSSSTSKATCASFG